MEIQDLVDTAAVELQDRCRRGAHTLRLVPLIDRRERGPTTAS